MGRIQSRPSSNHLLLLFSPLERLAEMKRSISIILAALIALGAALPFTQAAQADDPPPEYPEIEWTILSCMEGAECTVEGGEYHLDYTGVSPGGLASIGYDPDQAPLVVYYEITGSTQWHRDAGDYGDRFAIQKIIVNGEQEITLQTYCGNGLMGDCFIRHYGSFEVTGYIVPSIGFDNIVSPGIQYDEYGFDYHLILSGTPLGTDDCEEFVDQEEISSGTLDPTDEDGDLITLVADQQYRVSIFGGPWHDGGEADRYDAAVKNGEEDWQSVAGFVQDEEGPVECVQNDEEDVNKVSFVITAQDADFRIRVNDIVGSFANNTGSLDYSVSRVIDEGALGDCEDSFLVVGDPIYSNTIMAVDSAGELAFTKNMNGDPSIGDYIAITFTGTWQNNGTGDELQDVALKIGSSSWTSLDTLEGFMCSTVVGETEPVSTYYMQITSSSAHYLRVDDTDGSWGLNLGSVSYTVSMVVYAPPVNGCGMDFVVGDYLAERSAIANSSSGFTYEFPFTDLTMNGSAGEPLIFAVETSGSFLDMGVDSVAAEIWEQDMNPAWESLATYGNALCIETIDAVGHLRVYLGVYPEQPEYKFRVEDAVSYSDNSGMLDFKFYQAESLNVDDPPLGDPCGSNYTKGTLIQTITLDPTNLFYYLDMLDEGEYYAIETTDGPWYDDGASSNWVAMAATSTISGAPGIFTEFEELTEFSLCYQDSEDIYKTGFIYTQPGYNYFVRVYDDSLDLDDNTGSIKVRIYNATNEVDTWETCADAYSITQITTDPAKTVVPANQESGAKIEYILPGGFYAIEITGDNYWSDPDVEASYLAEICEAGVQGCTEDSWVPFSDADDAGIAVCVVTVDTTKPTYRIYADVDGLLKLRVADDDGTFEENSGKLTYILYGTTNINGLPDLPGNPNPWDASCYSSCVAPDGLFTTIAITFGTLGSVNLPLPNVGGWVSYATCRVVSYLTWCPEHTEALMGKESILDTVEPIATMNDMIDFVKESVALFKSVTPTIVGETAFSPDMNGVGGGPLGDTEVGDINDPPEIPIYIFYPDIMGDMNKSPWFGGKMDLTEEFEEAANKAEIISTCTNTMTDYLGNSQANMVCQLHYLITGTKFFTALATIMDAVLIFYLVFKYLPAYIKRWMNLFNSNKSILKGYSDIP